MLKRDQKELLDALSDLHRAKDYLLSDTILICRKTRQATTTLDYVNPAGESCFPLEKEIGSELCLLYSGIRRIERMLESATQKALS